MKKNKLSLKVLLGYGSGDIGGNLFFTVIAFWLINYLTDEIGLSGTLAGLVAMLGKTWDAITDPAVGFLSDRTKSRWGRRRPWLLFAAIPLGLAMFNMFRNPKIENVWLLFIWATISFMALSTFYTFVNIPYNSLTPDLTKDFNEKIKLNGFRMIFAVIGTFLGAGAAQPIIEYFRNKTIGYMFMGAIFGGIMTVFALIPFFSVKEPVLKEIPKKRENIFKSYLDILKNIPFLLILIPWTLNIIGITIVTGTLVYYFKYIFMNENLMTPAMIRMLIAALVFIILIIITSKKIGEIGKKKIYFLGMSIFTIAILIIFLFGHKLNVGFTFYIMIFAGIGFSTHYVMPWSILPDTIEYDYSKKGTRKEGVYYGLWTFVIKLGQAFAVFLIGFLLDVFKYIPPKKLLDGMVQPASAIFGIRLLIGPITAFFLILANIVLVFYPINKKRYQEIQEKIKRMEKK